MKLNLTLIAIVGILGAGIAQGKECKSVDFPEQFQVDGRNLSLNGLGLRQATMLKVNVYVAALYVGKKSSDPHALLAADTPSALVLQFVRDVGANDLRKGWDKASRKTPVRSCPR